jgi:hypothetical protein
MGLHGLLRGWPYCFHFTITPRVYKSLLQAYNALEALKGNTNAPYIWTGRYVPTQHRWCILKHRMQLTGKTRGWFWQVAPPMRRRGSDRHIPLGNRRD